MRRNVLSYGCVLVFLVCCGVLTTGCAQRIRAEVSAVVEHGYTAQGQSFALAVMPGFPTEDGASTTAVVEAALTPALQSMGYVAAAPEQQPEVTVRVWWFSSGPHPVYRTVEWRDRRYWHHRYGFRRQAVVVEEEYGRYLVVEGILNAGAVAAVQPLPSASAAEVAAPSSEQYASPEEASRALPAAPERLLWRVRVESRGNLSRAERVLPSLVAAAAPYLGKSGLVHVLVQEDTVVAAENVAP